MVTCLIRRDLYGIKSNKVIFRKGDENMLKLMNSAMMPVPGNYIARRITPDEAKKIFFEHASSGWQSYVGYAQTAQVMSSVLGVDIPVNRGETLFENGDIAIVCKLAYRVSDPANKGAEVPEDAFEWWYIEYKK